MEEDGATVSSAIDNIPSHRIYPTGMPIGWMTDMNSAPLLAELEGHSRVGLTLLVGFSRVLTRKLHASHADTERTERSLIGSVVINQVSKYQT